MIPTEPATLPVHTPDADDDVVGQVRAPQAADAVFTGDLTDGVFHPAVVVNVIAKSGPNPFKQGAIREQYAWIFKIEGQEDKGDVVYYTSRSLHEKSKFPKFCVAVGRPCPADGGNVKRSVFVGAKANLLTEMTKAKNSDRRYPKVTGVFPRA